MHHLTYKSKYEDSILASKGAQWCQNTSPCRQKAQAILTLTLHELSSGTAQGWWAQLLECMGKCGSWPLSHMPHDAVTRIFRYRRKVCMGMCLTTVTLGWGLS